MPAYETLAVKCVCPCGKLGDEHWWYVVVSGDFPGGRRQWQQVKQAGAGGERTNTPRLAQTGSLVQVWREPSVDVLVMRAQPQAVSRQAGKPDCSWGWS